jgi:hypothetical protein
MAQLSDIKVKFIPSSKWYERSKWELLKSYTSQNGEIKVPKGFITDGASIPLPLQTIFSPTGRYFGAAIIHDYVLTHICSWPEANKQFKEELIASDILKWRRVVIHAAVVVTYWCLKLIGRETTSYGETK